MQRERKGRQCYECPLVTFLCEDSWHYRRRVLIDIFGFPIRCAVFSANVSVGKNLLRPADDTQRSCTDMA